MAQPIQPGNHMAYDRTIVVFSPDGRLLQVEYARQMVKNGATSIGLKVKDAVILAGMKMMAPLLIPESYNKISIVDDHAAIVYSGSSADARDLIEIARVKAQVNKITYGEPISVSSLTRQISNRKHLVTQYAGVRPYGVGLLIGGVDDTGSKLYETDPSGIMIEWYAQAIGRGSAKAKTFLTKNYKENLSVEDGIRLILKALKTGEKKIVPANLEIVVIKGKTAKKLKPEELKKFVR